MCGAVGVRVCVGVCVGGILYKSDPTDEQNKKNITVFNYTVRYCTVRSVLVLQIRTCLFSELDPNFPNTP